MIVRAILDLIIIVNLFSKGFFEYYSSPFLWISFIELIFVVWVTEALSV